jgi:hypothetical protein
MGVVPLVPFCAMTASVLVEFVGVGVSAQSALCAVGIADG